MRPGPGPGPRPRPVFRPPVARVEPVRETLFGIAVEDPYRWMEHGSAEFDGWLDGQAAYARASLDALPDGAALRERVKSLRGTGTERLGFTVVADRVYFLRHDPGAAVPVLVVSDGTERVLLDPNALAGPVHHTIDWYVPSPDGRYVACGLSTGGSEQSTLRVLDVATGALLPDALPDVRFAFVSWLDDGESLLYHRFPPPPAGSPPGARRDNSRSLLHRLGDDRSADRVVLAAGLNPRVPLTPRDRPCLYRAPGSDHVVAVISHSALPGDKTNEWLSDCTLYVAPLVALVGPGADPSACPWVRVAEVADGVRAFAVGADAIYLVAHRDAPRRRVLAVPFADPAHPTVLVPEGERVVDGVRVAGDRLLLRELDAGVGRLRRLPLAGGEPEDVPLPVDGTILEWAGPPERTDVLVRVGSWTTAPRVYRVDAGSGAVESTGWAQPTPDGYAAITAYPLRAPARDGTAIPVTVIHRADLPRDGANPTLLEVYGSYGHVFGPTYRPGMLAWLERGGIWAVAHVRGGGEYGRGWHEAGRLRRKENTVTDCIDAAEYLVAQGYTAPGRLAGWGASAGGIPTGGALVRRPDLWGAMVMMVPVANLLRGEFTESGPINVPEFGSSSTEDGLHSLLAGEAYGRVADGVRYPAVLLTTGRNDRRVPTWQPAKMTARLQAATGSGEPVLLRVEEHAGHGRGSTADQRDAELADVFAFVFDRLGCHRLDQRAARGPGASGFTARG